MDVPLEGSKNARYKGRFSGPGNPSDRSHAADGEGHVDVLQVVVLGTFHLQFLPAGFGSLARPWNGFASAEVGPRDGRFARHHLIGGAVGHHHAAFKARSRPQVTSQSAWTQRVFIVFHHETGVAQVAEFSRSSAIGRCLADEADGRFIQHVHDARQTDCRFGWPSVSVDSHRLKGCWLFDPSEVVQPNAVEEAKTSSISLMISEPMNMLRSSSVSRRSWKASGGPSPSVPCSDESSGIVHRALADFGEADTPNRYVSCGTIELLAVAIRTIKIGHAGNEAISGAIRCGFSVGFLKARNVPSHGLLYLY